MKAKKEYKKGGKATSEVQYSTGIFQRWDPKYALRKPGFLIEVPAKMACRFVCPIRIQSKWSAIDEFIKPVTNPTV